MDERQEDTANEQSSWQPCLADELHGMVRRMKGRRRKVFAAQLAGGAAFGILAGLAIVALTVPEEHNFAGITCPDVTKHAEAYIAGRLDPELARQIDAHLAECPFCGPRFRQMMEGRKVQPANRKTTQVDDDSTLHISTFAPATGPVLASVSP